MAKSKPRYSIRVRSYADNAFERTVHVIRHDGPASHAVLTGLCLSAERAEELLSLLAPLGLAVEREDVPDAVPAPVSDPGTLPGM